MLEGPHILVAPHDHICGRVDDDSADDRCRVACCSVGLGAVALPNFRHSSSSARHAAQRHSAVHIPKAHPGRAGQHAAAAGHHAVGARPAPGADTPVSSPSCVEWGEAEAGKCWNKVKLERCRDRW